MFDTDDDPNKFCVQFPPESIPEPLFSTTESTTTPFIGFKYFSFLVFNLNLQLLWLKFFALLDGFNCDFQHDFCGWQQPSDTNGKWVRHTGSELGGPLHDQYFFIALF